MFQGHCKIWEHCICKVLCRVFVSFLVITVCVVLFVWQCLPNPTADINLVSFLWVSSSLLCAWFCLYDNFYRILQPTSTWWPQNLQGKDFYIQTSVNIFARVGDHVTHVSRRAYVLNNVRLEISWYWIFFWLGFCIASEKKVGSGPCSHLLFGLPGYFYHDRTTICFLGLNKFKFFLT